MLLNILSLADIVFVTRYIREEQIDIELAFAESVVYECLFSGTVPSLGTQRVVSICPVELGVCRFPSVEVFTASIWELSESCTVGIFWEVSSWSIINSIFSLSLKNWEQGQKIPSCHSWLGFFGDQPHLQPSWSPSPQLCAATPTPRKSSPTSSLVLLSLRVCKGFRNPGSGAKSKTRYWNQRCSSYHLRNYGVLGVLCQDLGPETQVILCYLTLKDPNEISGRLRFIVGNVCIQQGYQY